MNFKRTLIGVTTGAAALVGTMAATGPAEAAPLFTGGLVNVTLVDVADIGDVAILNDVTVVVAARVAAAICDVNVGGILGQLRDTGNATCTAANTGSDTLTITR